MIAVDSEVVQFFGDAVRSWSNGSIDVARDNFNWCLHLSHDGTDAIRALAATEDGGNGSATDEQITSLWENRNGYGVLLRAAGYPTDLISGKYDTGMWGVEQKQRTRSDIAQAYACVLIRQGEWDTALTVLKEADQQVPFTTAVRAFVYYKTRRWRDVLDNCELISTAVTYNSVDRIEEPPSPDYLVQGLASLMAGEALVYLERFDAAVTRLELATTVHNNVVAGRANYLTGMAWRALGDERAADRHLARALANVNDTEFVRAADDKSIHIVTTTEEMISQRTDFWDHNTEPLLSEKRGADSDADRAALLAEADAELNSFIGMDAVKRQIRKLKAMAFADQAKMRRGIGAPSRNQHILFTGPPGTGKTTVARVIGKMYAGLGIVSRSDVLETSRPDFVGDTVGSTGLKTKAVITKAMDGVLFIDEAYALVQEIGHGQKDSFGQEALDVLVAEMENNRDRLVVIMAGYNRDIERLLATNDGLKSRFSRKVEFNSYTPEEIWEIAVSMAAQRKALLGEGIEEELTTRVRDVLLTRDHNERALLDVAGNGRFVRNVIEGSEEERELRLMEETLERGITMDDLSNDELLTITRADVVLTLDRLIAEYL